MTAATLEGGVDTTKDSLVDLSEDKAVPCDADKCSQEAEYKCLTECCGGTVLLCSDCLINIKNNLKNHGIILAILKNFVCDFCAKPVFDPSWLIVVGKLKD